MRLITNKTLRLRLIYLPAFVVLIASLAHASTPTKKFEAGKKDVSRGDGVIRDPEIHKQVLLDVLSFVQKEGFTAVDYELFTLLAGHAATAIFSSKLYSQSERKLSTIQGFLDLLTN